MQHETPFRLLTIIEFKSNKFMDEICYYWCNGTCPFIFVLGTLFSPYPFNVAKPTSLLWAYLLGNLFKYFFKFYS